MSYEKIIVPIVVAILRVVFSSRILFWFIQSLRLNAKTERERIMIAGTI